MFGLKQFLKKRLRDKTRDTGQEATSYAIIRHAFTNRYLNFKTLLSTNNEILEIINDMEQAFLGSRSFDMSFIQANCTAVSVKIYKMIKCLNDITDRRYEELFGVLEDVLVKIVQELKHGKDIPITLGNVLKYIALLNLTDPDAPNFTPKACRTIHDIARFAYEMSLRELFDYKKDVPFPKHLAKRLVFDVPMQWWVIDLDDGFREGIGGETVRLEDITSAPMLTLWEGITAVPWKGPPPVDTKGFLSVMYGATMDSGLVPGMRSRYAERNYFIISRNFCHLSSRFGFHFSTVEAFFGDRVAENYICFNYNGGGADPARRERRAHLIKLILEKFDFWVQVKGDLIFARLERQEQEFLKERLKVLGHLVMHTRQLDMVLSNSERVNWYLKETLKQISSFVAIPQ